MFVFDRAPWHTATHFSISSSDGCIKQAYQIFIIWMLACFGCALTAVASQCIDRSISSVQTSRIGGVNLKPVVETQERLMKPQHGSDARQIPLFWVHRLLTWGLSRHSATRNAAACGYNISAGGGPYSAYRYLQHIMSYHPPALVVLGVDFEFFIDSPDFIPMTRPPLKSALLSRRPGELERGPPSAVCYRYFTRQRLAGRSEG